MNITSNEKIVIIVNGSGTVGKTTLQSGTEDIFNIEITSSITPIIEIAKHGGYDGAKDNKSRKLLSDIKKAFSEYNNLSNKYIMRKLWDFLYSNKHIMFVDVREKDQIIELKTDIEKILPCVTLLIRQPDTVEKRIFGNDSDDNVEDYSYDYYFINDKSDTNFKENFNNLIFKIYNKHK